MIQIPPEFPLRAAHTGSDAGVTELLLSVAGGDEAAFGQLYDAVSGRVFGLACRITQNRALAEEVTQEVMVEVWRTAPRFDAQRRSGIGWVLMLAHRRAVDRVRHNSTRHAREMRDAAALSVQAPNAEAVAMSIEPEGGSAQPTDVVALAELG